MTRQFSAQLILLLVLGISATAEADDSLHDRVRHAPAASNGVKIHYVTLGKGPLVVMIHGFPAYWYTWRHQMAALAAPGRPGHHVCVYAVNGEGP